MKVYLFYNKAHRQVVMITMRRVTTSSTDSYPLINPKSNKYPKPLDRSNLKIYTHFTCATDTTQIRFVMAAVNGTLIPRIVTNT